MTKGRDRPDDESNPLLCRMTLPSRPFRVYGHRGAAAHEPENTLRSFLAALAGGATAIETDVRLTADGQVVVFHDATGARTCSDPRALAHTAWAEISRWHAGRGEHPILLAELFEALPNAFVNVDVKDDRVDAARATVEVVRRAGAARRVGLGSFHPRVARAIRREGWRGQLALCAREVAAIRFLPDLAARLALQGDAVQIPVASSGVRLDHPSFVARCHRLGLRVDYWTIDDPQVALQLVRSGADGIVTNDPATITAALAAR